MVDGRDENPYILRSTQRYGEDGERVYSDMPDGTWWQELDAAIGDSGHVFPVSFYIDETYLTGRGSQTAKPVYVQTGGDVDFMLCAAWLCC